MFEEISHFLRGGLMSYLTVDHDVPLMMAGKAAWLKALVCSQRFCCRCPSSLPRCQQRDGLS